MSEYMQRKGGGFYIIDDPERDSRVMPVHRAVNQVINPQTGHPFPEQTPPQAWAESLAKEYDQRVDRWRNEYNFTNSVAPEAPLTQESLEETIAMLRWGR